MPKNHSNLTGTPYDCGISSRYYFLFICLPAATCDLSAFDLAKVADTSRKTVRANAQTPRVEESRKPALDR